MLPVNITYFLKNISFIYKDHNNGWLSILCPFCDDATRKNTKITHGHFYISTTFNYCNCFRCDYANSLSKALVSLGFSDKESLLEISKNNNNNFQYFSNKLNTSLNKVQDIYSLLECEYDKFKYQYPNEFKTILNYIYYRCLDIDPIFFLIKPTLLFNYISLGFYNINGQEVTYRYINNPKTRYYIPQTKNNKPYYFFQDIYELMNYNNIVICEGNFDLINLYRYNTFQNAFFIAIGGKQFRKLIQELLCNYLLIGNYTFNIIFDNDINFKPKKLIDSCKSIIQQLNPACEIKFYMPSNSKDVSDLMDISQINK